MDVQSRRGPIENVSPARTQRRALRLVTGEDGLAAMAAAGGATRACFAMDPDSAYPAASGARIAKTYAQLAARPKTGQALFDELNRQDWRLPVARRPFRPGEYREHLRYLVREERLHVVEPGRLTPDTARSLRADLKGVMTAVASGRDGVASLLHQVERVARYASGRPHASLGQARGAMRTLVGLFAGHALRDTGLGSMDWERLSDFVRDARNDIAHTGTEAVLTETRTMALAGVLLEALLGVAGEDGVMRLAEVMVANPVCIHGWQTVADVRRTMLVTDFTELPLADGASDGGWSTVTADSLAAYLGSDRQERKNRMGRTVDEAMDEARRPLTLCRFPTAAADTPVSDVWEGDSEEPRLPVMVTREETGDPKLVGIVTAFDLL